MSSDRVTAAVASMTTAVADLADLDCDQYTHLELLELLGELETLTWRLPTIGHRVIARLHREASPVELGAKSLKSVLTQRLRISGKEATRRLAEATQLGPRTALNGEPLQPLLAPTATAQSSGAIGREHVTEIRSFLDKLPTRVDPDVRELSEKTLVVIGSTTGPDEVRKAAEKLAAAIDQDGPEPDDRDRARKRFIRLGSQQADGMTKLTGLLDPEARATIEPILAKLAAPGMCNPDDHAPRTSGTPTQEQIDADTRSPGQRTHDALIALARTAMSSGELGRHNGLPVTVIVTTTLQDLEAARGSGVTGGGSLLPMADLIRMASHAHHYLAVFDKHTSEALYLGRTKRLASAAQRIVLHARDRGCTKPGCTVPGYGTQVHHTTGWAKNGQTNVDEVTFACGGDNRLAEHGWTVQLRDGVVEWLPPRELDVGQARVNYLHHPERLLAEPGP
ncbi:HNH endonuclease [Mycolicibacterium sp. P1-18]|uniref:HNH endonuclease signature motif containing protein n=1 Tax=Mycolicibacterium sp. P1-18 TaxID=2024615 RepID=UPI0011F12FCC|nr:HNH endonuclease signature motif containing protein [Mycolicibacterium sp. P1-18]KAA0099505.1 HNH endonuclease [Mycolicibacterium sp. P1-18]